MSKIKFKYGTKAYELTYTRDTAKQINSAGFNHTEIQDKFPVMIPMLVQGAFLANHRREVTKNPAIVDEIYDSITDKPKFIEALLSMYIEAVETLIDEPEDSEKNTKWDLES